LLDLWWLGIDPTTREIVVATALVGTVYESLGGRRIAEPTNLNDRPTEAVLARAYAKFEAAELARSAALAGEADGGPPT
jgi:hypothetical protein